MKKMSKVTMRNILKLLLVSFITVAFAVGLIMSPIVNGSEIMVFGNDFQFNLLNFSGVLAGFLFTGIGILISTIDKERIKRLWDHHYLDNLYYCAALGILANIMVILLGLVFVGCNLSNVNRVYLVDTQIVFLILGLVYFIWCTLKLIKLMSRMRE